MPKLNFLQPLLQTRAGDRFRCSNSIRKLTIRFNFDFDSRFDSMNIDLIKVNISLQVVQVVIRATNLYIKLFTLGDIKTEHNSIFQMHTMNRQDFDAR